MSISDRSGFCGHLWIAQGSVSYNPAWLRWGLCLGFHQVKSRSQLCWFFFTGLSREGYAFKLIQVVGQISSLWVKVAVPCLLPGVSGGVSEFKPLVSFSCVSFIFMPATVHQMPLCFGIYLNSLLLLVREYFRF